MPVVVWICKGQRQYSHLFEEITMACNYIQFDEECHVRVLRRRAQSIVKLKSHPDHSQRS